MKSSLRTLTSATVLLLCATLNSCYFNSAGHLFEKASYRAAADVTDLKPGDAVYCKDGEYYIELQRYRFGKAIRTQYDAFETAPMNPATKHKLDADDVDMFKIPADYAMYLTGQAEAPVEPSFFERTDDADDIKQGASTLTVSRAPEKYEYFYHHTSPAAALWYTAGALDWLCVDLPVTCLENTLLVCGGFFVVLFDSPEGATTDDIPEGGFERQPIIQNVYEVRRVYY